MPRLPQPGSDAGTWGEILNDYLAVAHASDGTLKAGSVTNSSIQPGAITSTKFSAGTPSAGQVLSYNGTSLTWQTPSSGVTDHGLLSGLTDDDHPQYHTDARGDARYYTQAQVDTSLSGKANTSHTHAIADVTNLQTSLDGKAASSHAHVIADTTGLQTALDAKAPVSHMHGYHVFPVGRTATWIPMQNGSSSAYALDTEYGLGFWLSAMTIGSLFINVNGAGAGESLRMGLRPIDPLTRAIGTSLFDVSLSAAATGPNSAAVNTAIPTGLYALTWVKQGGTAAALMSAESTRLSFVSLQSASAGTLPATGHQPVVGILNTGVSGALPSTVTEGNVTGNLPIPGVWITRSA